MATSNSELLGNLRSTQKAVDAAERPTQALAEIGQLKDALTKAIGVLAQSPGGPVGTPGSEITNPPERP